MDPGQNTSSPGDQYPIYVGIWTNWSRGRIFGSTLTLSRRDANLLIAFTAFFIAFVTTRVWRIICFVFHRIYSNADPRDAIYHQRQTIFRNSSSPESGIQMLLWLLWANRHARGWLRPLPAVIVATLCISLFTVAGGFSSQISTAVGNEVLIKTSNCGYIQPYSGASDPLYSFKLSTLATIITSAANYAQQCYSSENTGLLDCNRFAIQKVAKSVDRQASCPFKSHLCRNGSANLRIDSGFLDSHDVLGFNAPPDERILFRNVLHCAPLETTGFTHEGKSSLGNYMFYRYGSYTNGNRTSKYDYVHAAPSIETQYAPGLSQDIIIVANANYVLSTYSSNVLNQTTFESISTFVPIDDIFRKDADLFLFFLSGDGVVFSQFSDDGWYNLNTTPSVFPLDYGITISAQIYIPTNPASPLSCTNQYQFCSTAFQGTSGCGPLASLRDAAIGAVPFFDTTFAEIANTSSKSARGAQFLYFINMYFSSSSPLVREVVEQLGAASLTSQNTLTAGMQGPIASDQWQRDVVHWWDISMALQQSASLSQAYIPDNSDLRAARFNYTAPEFQKICSNQKIRTTAYASFSLFGLFFTLTAGLLLTLASYILEPISSWLHKRKGYNQYPHLEWTTNSTLQLQRLAHEELGFGTWSEGTETIPVTKPGQMLGSLDISDPKHPVLRRPMDTDDAPPTVVGDSSEHTNISLALSDGASDAQHGVNMTPQNDLTGDEIPIEGQQLSTETGAASPSDSPPSEQNTQPTDSEHLETAQRTTETPIVDSAGTRTQI